MTIEQWAQRWAIPPAALVDLRQTLLGIEPLPTGVAGQSEAAVQAAVRVAASRRGLRVWRNNVGAVHDAATDTHIRYGLANDSKQVNAVIKSADLIGIRPRVISPADIGTLIGQFISIECKHGGWKFTGSEREQAQVAWATLVRALGGEALFVTGAEQLP